MGDQAGSQRNIEEQAEQLKEMSESVLNFAQAAGASAAVVNTSEGHGLSVNVRLGEVETLEYHRDRSVSVTVYRGQRRGNASTTDISPEALKATVEAACAIAEATGEDPCAGLAPKELMAWDYPDLDLYHPWALAPQDAIDLAKHCENHARAQDDRITNSDGASLDTYEALSVYANSHGFMGVLPSSRHGMSCVLVGESDGDMERDYYYSSVRDANDLLSPEAIAEQAAERTVRRLGAKQIATCQVPVLFEAPVARSLLGHFVQAISGGNLYRQASFLLNQLGEQVFSEGVRLYEQPHQLKGLGSSPFDGDGVLTREQDFVKDGKLSQYALGIYSARKLGLETTANAGGVNNLQIDAPQKEWDALLQQMGRGLLVTEMMGQGANIVTGDFSRGAVGFWVEDGKIQYPVQEITVAGNLSEMFRSLVGVGSDVDRRGNIHTGSLLFEKMTIAGQ